MRTKRTNSLKKIKVVVKVEFFFSPLNHLILTDNKPNVDPVLCPKATALSTSSLSIHSL